MITDTTDFSVIIFSYTLGRFAETIKIKMIPATTGIPEIGDLIVIGCFHPGKGDEYFDRTM